MGQSLQQENNIRRSTCCGPDTYDPAVIYLKQAYKKALLFLSFLLISATTWSQTEADWVPTVGNDWDNSANWVWVGGPGAATASGIPDSTTNVFITSGTSCNITSNSNCRNITINGTLIINSANTLNVFGDWELDLGGTFTPNNSAIRFVGNSISSITGTATFNGLVFAKNASANNIIINSPVTITKSLQFNQGTLSGTSAINITEDLITGTASQTAILDNYNLIVNRDVIINNSSTLSLAGPGCNMQVGRGFVMNGNFSANSPASVVTFIGQTDGFITGSSSPDVFPSNFVVAKMKPAIPSAGVNGRLTIPSGQGIRVNGNATVSSGELVTESNVNFEQNFTINGTGIFTASSGIAVAIEVKGNWNSNAPGAVFNAGISALVMSGSSNTTINPKAGSEFNQLIIQKSQTLNTQATVTFINNPLRIRKEVEIQSGALLASDVTAFAQIVDAYTATNPANFGVIMVDPDEVSIPLPDLYIGGNLLIFDDASLRLDNDDDNTNPNGICMHLGGSLTDNNNTEPAITLGAKRSLWVGSPNMAPATPNSNRPTIVFVGDKPQDIKGNAPQLRGFNNQPNQGLGIALPNVIINKTNNDNKVSIDASKAGSDRHKLRIFGNLTIIRGTFFTNGTTLRFGDEATDEINVFGIMDVNPGSTLFFNTGGQHNGAFLRGRRGGLVRLIGSVSNPINVNREENGTGQYYRTAIYDGCSIQAYYTNFNFQSSAVGAAADNFAGFSLPGLGKAYTSPGNGGLESKGGFKVYAGAVINPVTFPSYGSGYTSADPTTGVPVPYNFSYCASANGANNLTVITINTGQTLEIEGFNFGGSSNIANNNNCVANTDEGLSTITFIRSRGALGGIYGESFDGGIHETTGNPPRYRILWDTYPFMYWVGNYDQPGFRNGTPDQAPATPANASDWTDWRNWSLDDDGDQNTALKKYNNPNKIYPGQTTAIPVAYTRMVDPDGNGPLLPIATIIPADTLEKFEVFITKSATSQPVINTAYITIQGSLTINSGVTRSGGNINPVNRMDIDPSLHGGMVQPDKILTLGNNTLNVRGDLTAEVNGQLEATGTGTVHIGSNMAFFSQLPVADATPPGLFPGIGDNINPAIIKDIHQFSYTVGAGNTGPTLIIDGPGQQEVRVWRNVLHNVIVNKPSNVVAVQGLVPYSGETSRFTVNNNFIVQSGEFRLQSRTSMLINGDFIMTGGRFNFVISRVAVRGNWNNTGGVVELGDGNRINFHPNTTTARTIRSNNQPFPEANFGYFDDGQNIGNYRRDAIPEDYASGTLGVNPTGAGVIADNVTYTIIDNFTSVGLTTIYENRTVTTIAGVTTPLFLSGLHVLAGGTMDLKGGAEMLMKTVGPFSAPANDQILVDAGGRLNAVGTPTASVYIGRQNLTGNYKFTINGIIKAQYYFFQFMDVNGVDLRNGNADFIDAAYNDLQLGAIPLGSFSNGTLAGGAIGTAGVTSTYLYLPANYPRQLIIGANFPDNIGTPAAGSNVRKDGGVNPVYFKDATGAYAGENFDLDYDDANLYTVGSFSFQGNIRWEDRRKRWSGTGLISGTLTNSWHDPKNWVPVGVPAADDDVVLDFTAINPAHKIDFETYGFVVKVDAPAICKNLTIETTVSGTTRMPIYVILDNNASSDLTLDGFLSATSQAEIRVTNAGNDIRVANGWSNAGRFQQHNGIVPNLANSLSPTSGVGNPVTFGTVTFTGATGGRALTTAPWFDYFWNVDFDKGNTRLTSRLNVNNDLRIGQGAVLDVTKDIFPIYVNGNWINDRGTFIPKEGTVHMETRGPGLPLPVQNKIIKNLTANEDGLGEETFYGLAINKTSTPIDGAINSVILDSRVIIGDLNGGLLTLTSGKFKATTANEMILTEKAGWTRPFGGSANTSFVDGPVGRFFSSATSEVTASYPISKGLSDFTSAVELKIRLNKGVPTVFTIEQYNLDPDADDSKQFPAGINLVSSSKYWEVKNMAPYPDPNNIGDIAVASVTLPFNGTDETVQKTTDNGWCCNDPADPSSPVGTPFTLDSPEALAYLTQLSVLQDYDNYSGFGAPQMLDVKRGTSTEGDLWNDLDGSFDISDSRATITSRDFTTLGNGFFTFGFNYAPLPVELISFEAVAKEEKVLIQWITAREEKASHYVIERSTNGENFSKIGRVAATNLNTIQKYQFIDANPVKGTNYYRLRQVDQDSKAMLSKIVAVNIEKQTAQDTMNAQLYPNPSSTGNFTIVVPEQTGEQVGVIITDMLGKTMFQTKANVNQQVIEVNAGSALETGVYLVHIFTSNGKSIKKLVVN